MMRTIIALLVMLLSTTAFAAGSCKTYLNEGYLSYNGRFLEVDVECTGDASDGTVPSITIPFKGPSETATVFNFPSDFTLAGRYLYSVESDPVTQPVTAYTVTITYDNDDPIWVLLARSATAKEHAFVLSDKAAPPAKIGRAHV